LQQKLLLENNIKEEINRKLNANITHTNFFNSINSKPKTNISPLKMYFNKKEKSNSPIKELDIFRRTHITSINGFSDNLGFENTKGRFYNISSANNGNSGFLINPGKISNVESNTSRDFHYGNKGFLPNVNGRQATSKEKGMNYNTNLQNNSIEKKYLIIKIILFLLEINS